jgi:hypothetical protein
MSAIKEISQKNALLAVRNQCLEKSRLSLFRFRRDVFLLFLRFEHFPTQFSLCNLDQGNVRGAETGGFGEQGPGVTAAGHAIKLAHTPRDKVDENVGVPNFFKSFFS